MVNIHDDSEPGNRDKPLSFHWKALDQEWLDGLDPPKARSKTHAEARASILLEAHLVGQAEPERFISYSRAHGFYSKKRRYHGTAYSYRNVVGAIDESTRLGLLENNIAQPGSRGRRSTFRATGQLLDAINRPLSVLHDPIETIRLKDADKNLVDYRDTASILRMRREMQEINEAIAAADIDLPIGDRDGHVVRCGNHTLYPDMQAPYRVFNRETFSAGGRLYGGWWQQTRKADRKHLTIGGDPTVEADYSSLHPNMLYAESGKAPPSDAYDIDEWPRELVKVAFNVMVNAPTPRGAANAVAKKLGGGKGSHAEARKLIDAIEKKHAPIADAFGSDAGIGLQRTDSDMAVCVVQTLIRKGVVALPIHDSFITRKQDAGALLEAMNKAAERVLPTWNIRIKSTGCSDLFLHMPRRRFPLSLVSCRSSSSLSSPSRSPSCWRDLSLLLVARFCVPNGLVPT